MNIVKTIEHLKGGTMSTYDFKRSFRNTMGINLSVRDLPDNKLLPYSRVFYADLKMNRLILTCGVDYFFIKDMAKEEPCFINHTLNSSPVDDLRTGVLCTTWKDDCSLIFLSGVNHQLSIVNTENFSLLEDIVLPFSNITSRWSTTCHISNPFNGCLIAVGCSHGHLPIADIRTGNVEIIPKKIFSDINTISWSPFNSDILACSSLKSQGLCIFDIRNPKKYLVSFEYSSKKVSDLQFADRYSLLSLRNTSLDLIDLYNFDIKPLTRTFDGHNSIHLKTIFGLNLNTDPKLIYLPSGDELIIIQYNPFKIINSYIETLFPIRIFLMNDYKPEMYSLSHREFRIWIQNVK